MEDNSKEAIKAEQGLVGIIFGGLTFLVLASMKHVSGLPVDDVEPATQIKPVNTAVHCAISQVIELDAKQSSIWKCDDGSIVLLQRPNRRTDAPDLTIEFK